MIELVSAPPTAPNKADDVPPCRKAILTIFKEAADLSVPQLTNLFTKFDLTQLEHFSTAIAKAKTKNTDIENIRDQMKTLGLSMADVAGKTEEPDPEPVVDKLAEHVAKTKPKRKQAKVKTIFDKFDIGLKIVKMVADNTPIATIMERLSITSTSQYYYCLNWFKSASKINNKFDVALNKIEIGKGITLDDAIKLIEAACKDGGLRKLNVDSDLRVAEYKTHRAVLVEKVGVRPKIVLLTHEHYNTYITKK